MKLEAKTRLCASFEKDLLDNLGAMSAAKSVDKKAAYAKTKDKALLKNVTSSLVYALMVANEFKHQKEVVCVCPEGEEIRRYLA